MTKNYIRLVIAVSMVFLLCGTAKAYTYTGGDWGGQETLVADGGYLPGIFISGASLTISRSAPIYNEGSDNLEFQVWNIDMRRTIVFPNRPGAALSFFSDDYITLRQGGSILAPQVTFALADNTGVSAGHNSMADIMISTPWYSDFDSGGRTIDGSYNIMDVPLNSDPIVLSSAVPIMPTQWLLGSGLAFFALFRRRYSRSESLPEQLAD